MGLKSFFRRRIASTSQLDCETSTNGSHSSSSLHKSPTASSSQSFEVSVPSISENDHEEIGTSANKVIPEVGTLHINGDKTIRDLDRLTEALAQRDKELKSLTEEKYKIQVCQMLL